MGLDFFAIQDIKTEYPKFKAGDTVSVVTEYTDEGKVRTQNFEGIVIKRRGEGSGETFTVRKAAYGNIYVEKTFRVLSPLIKKIEVKKTGKVRRARLNYLRERIGKKFKVKTKIVRKNKDRNIEVR